MEAAQALSRELERQQTRRGGGRRGSTTTGVTSTTATTTTMKVPSAASASSSATTMKAPGMVMAIDELNDCGIQGDDSELQFLAVGPSMPCAEMIR